MHEPYDDDFEEQEDYYKKDNAQNQYEKFFSIDPSLWAKYGNWFNEIADGLFQSEPNVWIVASNNFKKAYGTYYVGSNIHNSDIYKQNILIDKLNIEYKNHIKSHAKHFLEQPNYYKGMFEILN